MGSDHCHHCGQYPDADGDHSCPCPMSNSECLEHTLNPVGPTLTGQVPVYPSCPNHNERQHRDGKPPWCERCGWNRGWPAVEPRKISEPRL